MFFKKLFKYWINKFIELKKPWTKEHQEAIIQLREWYEKKDDMLTGVCILCDSCKSCSKCCHVIIDNLKCNEKDWYISEKRWFVGKKKLISITEEELEEFRLGRIKWLTKAIEFYNRG